MRKFVLEQMVYEIVQDLKWLFNISEKDTHSPLLRNLTRRLIHKVRTCIYL